MTRGLAERIDALKPLLTGRFENKVTFHDPRNLGRHSGEYDFRREQFLGRKLSTWKP